MSWRPTLLLRPSLFVGACLGTAVMVPLGGQTLFTYDFASVTTASGASFTGGTAGHAVFSDFTASGVASNSSAAGVFAFTGWTTGATTGVDTFTGAVDLTDYYQFTVTPATGYSLSLSSLALDAGRTSTGPRQFVVRSSADSFAANLPVAVTSGSMSLVPTNVVQFTDNTTTQIYTGTTVTLGAGTFANLATDVTFRIYAFNAEGSTGNFRIDNVAISGSASAVPEPATYAAGLGLLALALAAMRRFRAAGTR